MTSSRIGDRPPIELNDDYVERHPQLGRYGAHTELFEAAVRLSGHRPGLIVDVGCGEGRTLATLDERFPTDRLIGIDLSTHRARIVADRGFTSLVAYGHQLPLPDESCVLLFCRHVIEHVHDADLLLGDMQRILHRDGFMYLETPLRRRGAWYFYRNHEGRRVLDPTHVHEYQSVEALEASLLRNGLTLIQFNVRPLTYPLTHVLYRLVSGNRPPSERAAAVLEKHPLMNVRVPRYGEMQVLARRSAEHEDQR